MEVSVRYDAEDDLVLRCGDITGTIDEGVFAIAPSDSFVNGVARLFQKLIDKRDGSVTPTPTDKAHSHAGYLARAFAKRISTIPDESVVATDGSNAAARRPRLALDQGHYR